MSLAFQWSTSACDSSEDGEGLLEDDISWKSGADRSGNDLIE